MITMVAASTMTALKILQSDDHERQHRTSCDDAEHCRHRAGLRARADYCAHRSRHLLHFQLMGTTKSNATSACAAQLSGLLTWEPISAWPTVAAEQLEPDETIARYLG